MRFVDAVREQGERGSGGEVQRGVAVQNGSVNAQRQAILNFEFASVGVGSDVAGIGSDERTVALQAQNECGGEATFIAAIHALVQCGEDFCRVPGRV